jgi:hypothetical protein
VTNEPVQVDATAARAHAPRAGAVLRSRSVPEPVVPHAPQACRETEPVLSLARRRGRVAVAGPGGSARVAPGAERRYDASRAHHETEPVLSLARRRRRGAVVSAGPDGSARGSSAATERGHDAPLRQTVGDKRRATLRRGTASLTETVGRAPFELDGRRAGEGAR